MNTRTVAIVGAGLVGRLMAWRFARRGHAVTLYDRDGWTSRAACSWAAAGLLTPVAEAAAAGERQLCALGLRSVAQWSDLVAALPGPITLIRQGSLAVVHDQDLADLHEFRERIVSRLPTARCTVLDRQGLTRLEPALADSGFSQGLHLEDEGCIHSHEALLALERALTDLPVHLQLGAAVTRIAPHLVETASGGREFDLVVDCRGLGARTDLPGLRGVRGEIVELYAPEVDLRRPLRILHQRYPLYIVPRGPRTYAVGATTVESDSLAPVTVKAALELLGAAYAAHPGFRFAQITGMTANCRPAFDDHLPRILVADGLARVNGLYRHGFLLAPLVTDVAVRAVLGEPVAADEALLLGGAHHEH